MMFILTAVPFIWPIRTVVDSIADKIIGYTLGHTSTRKLGGVTLYKISEQY